MEYDTLFLDKTKYIFQEDFTIWYSIASDLLNIYSVTNLRRFKEASNYNKLYSKRNELNVCYISFKSSVRSHNDAVLKTKIEKAYKLIGDVEGRKLDNQQMSCIIKNGHNQLIVAGAGTGKTTTIIGKIKYLLKTNVVKPEDILVLSFTNASATEMRERIVKEVGVEITASTFHKLGLDIITKVNGCVPKISKLNLRKLIREQLEENLKSKAYFSLLCNYLLCNQVVDKSEFEFNTYEEYSEYLALNPPKTLKKENVKSYGEMEIANFLFKNSINYIYEHPYAIDTTSEEYGQYYPDFYLPDYKIYIEYFGINRNGDVPEYFKGKNGRSASEVYNNSIRWKRELHKNNNTILIECYAYEKFEDNLLTALEEKLQNHKVNLQVKTDEELWQIITEEDDGVLNGVIELFETIINLIRSNNYSFERVRELNSSAKYKKKNEMILTLLEPIYDYYCMSLIQNNEIDFNDMINQATEYVQLNKYQNPFKYVIVDEYQDISKARFSLLRSLRSSYDFDLFCVGDDWQSIYRFAGSDIDYIVNFEKYWGSTEISKIETTYRFSQKLIEISGNFIMQNPLQITKHIKGKSDYSGTVLGEINGYTEKYAIDFLTEKLNELPQAASIFFLGRYSFDVKCLQESIFFKCTYDNVHGMVNIEYKKRPDLMIKFLTAHKSKGLQADYVFIINNKCSKMGFPSKIQDAPILELLLENCDHYPYSEERRLFYVALTRAKRKVFLVTLKDNESEFVQELKMNYAEEIKNSFFECPLCGGTLRKKNGQYGEFYGCSNYQSIGCRYTRKIFQPTKQRNSYDAIHKK